MERTETDYCIIGAGPAGLTLALLLVRSGQQVVLVERARTLEREYRGEVLQPGVLSLLEDLDILAGARSRGSYELPRFQLIENGHVLMDIDYGALAGRYGYMLSMPQAHLLGELLRQCRAFPNFTYWPETSVVGLLRDGEAITGVETRGRERGEQQIRAAWVVGADGRYSKTRKLADISYRRFDVFEHDVVWFKVPMPADRTHHAVRTFRGAGNSMLVYDSFPSALQLGWTAPHRQYRAIAQQGLDHVKERFCATVPPYADAINETVTTLDSLTLLDVFGGLADEWVREGLVLIGDSAHTHPPIGAQGINLAIQDAVLLHPVLMRARRAKAGMAPLLQFQAERRADVARVLRVQERQAKMTLSQGRLGSMIRPRVVPLFSRSPLAAKVTRTIAFGPRPVQLQPEWFVA